MDVVARDVLAIDSSGSFCSVAVADATGVITVISSAGSSDHFEQLPLMVDRVCAEAKVDIGSLKEIRIGTGPGSFTGLRIGMSFAKGLAWALRVPLVGCSSLAGAAAAAMARDGTVNRVVVVADARRDEVFAAAYRRGAPVDEEVSVRIVPVSELVGEPWSMEGSQWVSPQRDFSLSGYVLVPEADTAKGLIKCSSSAPSDFRLDQIAVLEPTYLRAVAAKSIEERRLGA